MKIENGCLVRYESSAGTPTVDWNTLIGSSATFQSTSTANAGLVNVPKTSSSNAGK